jgi:hypothetical protein
MSWDNATHRPLLGVMSDAELAALAGISVGAVTARRWRARVARVRVPRQTERTHAEARVALMAAQRADTVRAMRVFGGRLIPADIIDGLPAGACDLLRGAL